MLLLNGLKFDRGDFLQFVGWEDEGVNRELVLLDVARNLLCQDALFHISVGDERGCMRLVKEFR